MYRTANYPTTDAEAEAFVAGQRHGTLIATPPDGFPRVSILPFVKDGDQIELHCVQGDSTFAAVQANPLVTFFVSDFLAWSPHHWVDPVDAGRATLHFRAVAYHCEATTSTDPADVAAALRRLLAAYEPGEEYRQLDVDEFYGPRLRRLATVRLRVLERDAKFKVGPAGSAELKQRIADRLRDRSAPGDSRAADLIELYLSGRAPGQVARS
jgi:transcriptional regulator